VKNHAPRSPKTSPVNGLDTANQTEIASPKPGESGLCILVS